MGLIHLCPDSNIEARLTKVITSHHNFRHFNNKTTLLCIYTDTVTALNCLQHFQRKFNNWREPEITVTSSILTVLTEHIKYTKQHE